MRCAVVLAMLAQLCAAQNAAPSLTDLANRASPARTQRVASAADLRIALRDWAESRGSATSDEPLNAELEKAGLFCHGIGCDVTRDASGYILPIKSLSAANGAPAGWTARTYRAGIYCGTDEEIHFYRGSRRVQARPSVPALPPLGNLAIEFSKPSPDGSALALVTGVTTSCVSNWQRMFFRLYRLGGDVTLLTTVERPVNIVDPNRGQRVDPDGFWGEIPYRGLDPFATFTRPHVLHYVVEGNSARRAEPVALRPVDFVDEWLTRPWAEMAPWSDITTREAHERLYQPGLQAEVRSEVACGTGRQIEIEMDGDSVFFQVALPSPRAFRMTAVSPRRASGCEGQGHPDYLNDRPRLLPPVQ